MNYDPKLGIHGNLKRLFAERNSTKTATQDVLVDVITEYEITMAYRFYLYNEGDECDDVTGGWITGKLDQTTFSPTPINGIKQEDSLKVSMTYGTGNKYSGFRTANPIDWASYGRINIEFSYQITQTGHPTMLPVFQLSLQNNAMSTGLELNSGSIVAADPSWDNKRDTKIVIPNSVGTYSHRASAKLPPVNLAYDIPTSPSYLLALIGWWWPGSDAAAANVTIKKIWLE